MTNTNYRDLQATLKSHRSNGVTLQCKLTATMDILHAELLRIQSEPIASVTFTFDDGLCLGHSTPTLFDTYVLHNHAQPSEQHDSELTRESFNEARELYPTPTPTRIANNYLHYICLALAYVYATIYIGCQVTHRAIALTTLHIKAWYLIAVIKRTLHDMSFKPFYLDS